MTRRRWILHILPSPNVSNGLCVPLRIATTPLNTAWHGAQTLQSRRCKLCVHFSAVGAHSIVRDIPYNTIRVLQFNCLHVCVQHLVSPHIIHTTKFEHKEHFYFILWHSVRLFFVSLLSCSYGCILCCAKTIYIPYICIYGLYIYIYRTCFGVNRWRSWERCVHCVIGSTFPSFSIV